MKNITRILIVFIALPLFHTLHVHAQMRRSIVSPEVHKEGTVTFRFNAPNATKVELNAGFLKENLAMTKDENGLWSVTTPAVAPDLYAYSFFVDGVAVNDPNNVLIVPNERFKQSLVDVPGTTPSVYAVQDVPHGKISYRFYKSETLKDTRPLVVYTPPGYDPQGSEKYPVLYLLHGATDTHETWFKVGRVNFILDNLIAQGKAVPMIVVMPYANPLMTFAGKLNTGVKDSFDYKDELTKEIIPFMEKHYRVRTASADRVIAKQAVTSNCRAYFSEKAQQIFK